MVDILPFPRIIGNTPEEQVHELYSYLIQFKETLEFALMNISTENLAPDLIKRLNELGANIENGISERENELAQISKGNALTVFDVVNSNAFNAAVTNRVSDIKFNINFENGHLEYGMSEGG